jgi:hypothetical protein
VKTFRNRQSSLIGWIAVYQALKGPRVAGTCGAEAPNVTASWMPAHDVGAAGGRKRLAPPVGAP